MLSKRFADENGILHVFNKKPRNAGQEFEYVTPAGVFWKRDFHTIAAANGAKDTSLESELGSLESFASPVLDKIITCVRGGRVPSLFENERTIWARFFGKQLIRTPLALEALLKFDKNCNKAREQGINSGLAKTNLSTAEKENLKSRCLVDNQNTHKPSFRADILRDPDDVFPDVFGAAGIGLAKIAHPQNSFVIGDFTVILENRDGKSVTSGEVKHLWLPIAYDLAVTPILGDKKEKIIEVDDHFVAWLNACVTERSDTIAGRSDVLIKSLAAWWRSFDSCDNRTP
jgi:hypothetical protein